MPNEGIYVNRKIKKEEAQRIIWENSLPEFANNITSALGHQGSVDAFNVCFPDLKTTLNRIVCQMSTGDEAIALKVIGRVQEGQILTMEQLEELGYEFFHITNIGASFNEGNIINSKLGYLSQNGSSKPWVHIS
jgi:hypothetical protein